MDFGVIGVEIMTKLLPRLRSAAMTDDYEQARRGVALASLMTDMVSGELVILADLLYGTEFRFMHRYRLGL